MADRIVLSQEEIDTEKSAYRKILEELGPSSIYQAQKNLREEGLYRGSIDGKINDTFLNAVVEKDIQERSNGGSAILAKGSLESETLVLDLNAGLPTEPTFSETAMSWVKDKLRHFAEDVSSSAQAKGTTKVSGKITYPDQDSNPNTETVAQMNSESKFSVNDLKKMDAEQIRGLQQDLKAFGYDAGKIDGLAGENTLGALEQYAKANNIDLNKFAGKDSTTISSLQEELQGKVNLLPDANIRRGLAHLDSSQVKQLQIDLNQLNQNTPGYKALNPDGVAGELTRNSLKLYAAQENINLGKYSTGDVTLFAERKVGAAASFDKTVERQARNDAQEVVANAKEGKPSQAEPPLNAENLSGELYLEPKTRDNGPLPKPVEWETTGGVLPNYGGYDYGAVAKRTGISPSSVKPPFEEAVAAKIRGLEQGTPDLKEQIEAEMEKDNPYELSSAQRLTYMGP